ncbi:Flagellar hook-associated protein 1 OS=Lysinibacillus sphaericus OX=1421 GN=flgK PE=3 SV=1 [Lysinibacillus sphaericus]
MAIERANHLAQSFNYMDTQLKTIQGNIGNEISVSTNRINSLLKQIASINKQVQEVEPNGHVPNDLYDARDVLIDELNSYIPVSVERVPSGGLASSVAEGSVTITFKPYGTNTEIKLVNGKDAANIEVNSGTTQIDGTNLANLFTNIKVNGTGTADSGTITYDQLEPGKGKLLSVIDSYGYESATGPQRLLS